MHDPFPFITFEDIPPLLRDHPETQTAVPDLDEALRRDEPDYSAELMKRLRLDKPVLAYTLDTVMTYKAAATGGNTCLETQIAYDGDLARTLNKDDEYPLFGAVRGVRPDIVQRLAPMMTPAEIDTPNRDGQTAMQYAIELHLCAIADMLKGAGGSDSGYEDFFTDRAAFYRRRAEAAFYGRFMPHSR